MARTDPSLMRPATSAAGGASSVHVNVGGSGTTPAAPAATSDEKKPPLITWWPVILFALTLAAAAGGLTMEVRSHGLMLEAMSNDLKGMSKQLNDLLLIERRQHHVDGMSSATAK